MKFRIPIFPPSNQGFKRIYQKHLIAKVKIQKQVFAGALQNRNKSSFEFRAIVKISKLISQVSWRSKIKYFVTVLSEKKFVNIFHDAYFLHGTRKKFHKNMFLNCCCNQFTNYISFYPNTFQCFSTFVGKYWSINPITSGIHKMVKHTLKNY